MNCHGNEKNKTNGNSRHSHFKHMLMMIFCCALPILIIALLPYLGSSPKIRIMLGSIAPFICPLMMLMMIPMMFGHSHGRKENHGEPDKGNDIKVNE